MGPISYTGRKTSRAARDRPELNPRRIQPSRHHRSFAGAVATGGGGATTKSRATQGRTRAHDRAQERRSHAPSCVDRGAHSLDQRRIHAATSRSSRPATIARSGDHRAATSRGGSARRPAAMCDKRARLARPAAINSATGCTSTHNIAATVAQSSGQLTSGRHG
ncbi:putative histone-lysine N-methyltransferase ATXR3 [Dorcoceras hygrometricum]|uniref:Putative histone-lysine N-methyltransferase ATXR3 n=1 Tax=Dorcoceras hygrometricum TaxID=472368 RepID=A0A2Z6ZV84_9LAMI|nr:putative histone-lysine N-methyltransferase ATXR3 [Dorcoceras hygrometricum]